MKKGEQNPAAVCVACGDTGHNSNMGECHPCRVNGRLGRPRYASAYRIDGELEYFAGPTYNVNKLREYEPLPFHPAFIVRLGPTITPIARWKDGRWQRKKKA